MDYLARESADLSDGLWNRIDETAIGTARAQLTCRRFLKVFGPLGAGVTTVAVDGVNKEEVLEDGIGRIVGRTQLELPLFYEDFTLLSRDMEYAAQTGYPLDLSVAIAAAKKASRREDDLILNGSKALGTDGLLTVKGSSKIKKSDWSQGENSFADITAGVAQLAKTGYLGRYALVVSPDLFLDLQRLQPNTGLLEIDRIKKLIGAPNENNEGYEQSRQGRARVRRARVPGSCHRPGSVGWLPGARGLQPHVPYHGNSRPPREGPRRHRGIRVTPSASIKHLRAACI